MNLKEMEKRQGLRRRSISLLVIENLFGRSWISPSLLTSNTDNLRWPP